MMLAAAAVQGAALPPAVPAAPAVSSPAPPQTDEQRIQNAITLGGVLYAFDRAAWVSTDALLEKLPKDQLTGLGGYVVETANPAFRVTYYRGSGEQALAFFVAEVREGKVVRADLLAAPVPLTPAQAALARARDIAARAAISAGYAPCTAAPFNTVVLPPRGDGPIGVYLLSAQTDARHWPMGGHYRLVISPDGKVLGQRAYSRACLNLDLPGALPNGAKPVGLFVTHALDPVPTEIHVFASYNLRMPLFVSTSPDKLWRVAGRSITPETIKR